MTREEAIKEIRGWDFLNEKEREAVETLIPELKESEDELKWLTEFIKEEAYYLSMDIRDDEDRIKLKKLQRSLTWLEKQKEPELPEDLGEYIAELSKQFPEVSFAKLSRIAVRIKNWFEKQGEQNHADKIEPKFKVGDWITNGIETVQITGYDIDYGYQVDYKGKLQHRDTDIIEKEYHLWTTQDVKHDDVLVVNWDNGYKLDDEKKELKKLSQRMISAEAKEALYDKPTDEEMKELLRTEYEKGRADTIAEMEREWSEGDEKMLEGIVNTVKDVRCQSLLSEIEIYDDYIDWLKSLKDRYTWKPSNEQIDTLEHFVRSIGESGYALPYDNNTKLLYSLLEQLKKLKA